MISAPLERAHDHYNKNQSQSSLRSQMKSRKTKYLTLKSKWLNDQIWFFYCRLIDQAENSLLHTRLAEEELKCRKLTIYSVRFDALGHLEHLTYSPMLKSFHISHIFCLTLWPNHIPSIPVSRIFARSLVTAMHLYTKAGFREVSFYLFIREAFKNVLADFVR